MGLRVLILCGLAAWGTGCSASATQPSAPSVPVAECEDSPVAPVVEVTQSAPQPPRDSGPLQVAITVDDLPSHGPSVPGLDGIEIHRRLLAAFAAHDVPQVFGFVNAQKLVQAPELRGALEAWVAAGHPLGNHTYSHPSLREMKLDAYFDDIAANEALLEELQGGERTATFRYPFLLEGMSRDDTAAIRAHLDDRGYRVADVTIDFYDWAFNPPYARCTELGDEAALAALRKTFISHAMEMLAWSDVAAQDLYGRRIPQVLLLHAGAFDAEMIEPLLTAMEDRGVEWIPLDQALADPAYADRPIHDGRNQGTLLDQKIEAEDGPHPPWIQQPRALLEVLCPR